MVFDSLFGELWAHGADVSLFDCREDAFIGARQGKRLEPQPFLQPVVLVITRKRNLEPAFTWDLEIDKLTHGEGERTSRRLLFTSKGDYVREKVLKIVLKRIEKSRYLTSRVNLVPPLLCRKSDNHRLVIHFPRFEIIVAENVLDCLVPGNGVVANGAPTAQDEEFGKRESVLESAIWSAIDRAPKEILVRRCLFVWRVTVFIKQSGKNEFREHTLDLEREVGNPRPIHFLPGRRAVAPIQLCILLRKHKRDEGLVPFLFREFRHGVAFHGQ